MLAARSIPEVLRGYLKFFVREGPTRQFLEINLGRLQEVQQAYIVTQESTSRYQTCIYSISGVGALPFGEDEEWWSIYGDQASGRDVGYHGQLMILGG